MQIDYRVLTGNTVKDIESQVKQLLETNGPDGEWETEGPLNWNGHVWFVSLAKYQAYDSSGNP